ncbi:coiled-coil domain-containing protein [Dialister invisus]|uniref:coiled-coil domain-containing protein n=1 Tax=Dialister invisus TaxID=218538 RepID=UPI003AB7DF05
MDKIIPLLLEQKGLADKNRVVSVTISGMNMVYDVTISEEGAYTIVENQSSYDVQELSLSDFNILYDRHMDISRKEMDALKSANKNLKNEIEGLKKLRDDYEQKKRDLESELNKLSELKKLLEDYEQKLGKAERKKSSLSSEERRCVCYSVTNRGNRSGDVGELLIVPKVKDRELVKKGQNLFEIISVTRTRTGGRGPKFKKSPENKKRILKSERDGKVFFDDELQSKNWRTCYVDTEETWCYSLKEKRQNYTLCYHYKSNQIKGFRVCVVGNTDDTPDEIHDWLVEKGKKESGDSSGKADLTKVSKKSSEKKSANGSAEVLKNIVNIKALNIKSINKIFKNLEPEKLGELIFNPKR